MRTTETLSLSLPPEMSKKVTKLMKQESRTRSELMREALRRYIEEREWEQILRYGKIKARQNEITEGQIEDVVDAYRK